MNSPTQTNEIEKGGAEFENAILQTGFGAFNIKMIILCGFCMMTAITESVSMPFVVTAAQCDLNLKLSDKTIIASIGFIGIATSCLFWGFISDLYGRQKLLAISTLLSFLFGVASGMVSRVWLLIILRFCNGVFNACPIVIIFTYVSECHSIKYRSKAISWIGSFISTTYIYLPCMAWLILTLNWSPRTIINISVLPWRLLIIILTFPNIILSAIFFRCPESPRFLWSIGKFEESLDILRKIYAINTKQDKSLYPVNEFKIQKINEVFVETDDSRNVVCRNIINFFKLVHRNMVSLFIMPLLPKTILSSLLQFGVQLSALGVVAWFPEFVNRMNIYEKYFHSSSATICESVEYFEQTGFTPETQNEQDLICTYVIDKYTFIISIIYGVSSTLFYVFMGLIIEKVGKKMFLIMTLFISGSSGFILNFMKEYNLKIILLILFLLCIMGSNTSFAIQVDLFPTEHRAKSLAFSQMIGRLAGSMGGLLTGALIKLCCPLIFFLFSIIILALIFIALLLPVPLFTCKRKIEQEN